jgi:hypothetical protein
MADQPREWVHIGLWRVVAASPERAWLERLPLLDASQCFAEPCAAPGTSGAP